MAPSLASAHTFHALSLETASGRGAAVSQRASGSVVSMLSSSFLGDMNRLVSNTAALGAGQLSHSSRSFQCLSARMDASRIHQSRKDAFDEDSWKRPAVALADYAVAERDLKEFPPRVVSRSSVDVSDGEESDSQPFNGGSDISTLGLRKELVDALRKRGITHLFPIQEAVLKPATEGLDLIGRARTGTGKTLAFGIPIIQNLLEQNQTSSRRFSRNPRVLVLAPTRELAMQVEKEFMESAPSLSTLCVYGGVPIGGQQRKLQGGVDIAVGTPGRIMDLIERGSLQLNEVRYLVLDEADQMLAIGFAEDVEKILQYVPSERQSMLFSATMPSWVSQISRKYLKNPLKIDLVGDSKEKLAQGIKLFSIACPPAAKRSILNDLITVYGKGGKTIVFTQTKKDADEVSMAMSRILGAEALHGDISQAQREKTLARFRSGKFTVLIATDVAARGLDIPDVDLVIHYEAPNDPETFVHRSGRTGRAGKDGTAILIHANSQTRTLRTIERDVGCKFEPISAPTVEDVLTASSEQARDALSKVHPELTAVFLPIAQALLQEQGADALAAAIAHLSGFTQPPASRSLITHEQGWMTVQFTRTRGGSGLLSPGGVMGALASICQRATDEVGKILMLDPSEGMGAVFDLPEDIAKELLALPLPPGDEIQAISKLPRLQYADAPRDSYGMFSSRGGGFRSGRGGSMRGRGSYGSSSRGSGSSWGGSSSWGDSRKGSSWDDNSKSGGSWGDNSRNGSSWGDNSRSGSSWSDRSGGSSRSGSSWGGESSEWRSGSRSRGAR